MRLQGLVQSVPACMEDMPRSSRMPSATPSKGRCRASSSKADRSEKVPCSTNAAVRAESMHHVTSGVRHSHLEWRHHKHICGKT